MVAVNLVGMSNYCKAALPQLRKAGKGSVVNVSSCYAGIAMAARTPTM